MFFIALWFSFVRSIPNAYTYRISLLMKRVSTILTLVHAPPHPPVFLYLPALPSQAAGDGFMPYSIETDNFEVVSTFISGQVVEMDIVIASWHGVSFGVRCPATTRTSKHLLLVFSLFL